MKSVRKTKQSLPTILSLFLIGIIILWIIFSMKNSNSETGLNMAQGITNERADTLSVGYSNYSSAKQIDEMTLAQKLVFIESGKERSVNDPYVITVDRLLNELSEKYHEPKDSIADYTQKAQAVLKEDNVTMLTAHLMNEVNISKRYQGTKYKDMISVYMMLYGKGGE